MKNIPKAEKNIYEGQMTTLECRTSEETDLDYEQEMKVHQSAQLESQQGENENYASKGREQNSTTTIKSPHEITHVCQNFGVRDMRKQIRKSI